MHSYTAKLKSKRDYKIVQRTNFIFLYFRKNNGFIKNFVFLFSTNLYVFNTI